MSNLNKIKEEGEESFYKEFAKDIGGLLTLKKPLDRKEVLNWHNKQIDKAYSLAINEVLKAVEEVIEENYKVVVSFPFFRAYLIEKGILLQAKE